MNATTRNSTSRLIKMLALLLALGLTAAACGASDEADPASDDTSTTEAMEDEAMEDEAMEDEAMEDEAMEETRPELTLSFSGLESLGPDFNYEGWVMVDGTPVSSGVFDIDSDGSIDADGPFYGHDNAEAVVISIEPQNDTDPAPAATKILGGPIAEDGSFELSIAHPAALGTDFSDATGQFILGTPTDDPDGNELSGVWFLTVPGSVPGLNLPVLPVGWAYEGWVVIDGQPVTTGRFTDPATADDFAGFSGPNRGPDRPGEDFITNAPDGQEFPTDLAGSTIVISVEPDADNSPAPFALKPLVADVPEGVSDHSNLNLGAGSVAISGTGVHG